ncbi:MAG: amidohydrolase family protein [Acidovorax sp.]|jgi:5-methylthioadenosine/S-adenosylhomocysteine deaminase
MKSRHAGRSTGIRRVSDASQHSQTRALIIRHARVLTLDDNDREWADADIVVRDGRIVAIGPGAADSPEGLAVARLAGSAAGVPVRLVDARGLLAMPGLVNGHFHSPGNLMKGLLPGLPLELFMLHEVPPLADSGNAGRLSYLRTMAGALEMIRRGVTAVHDDAYHVPLVTPEGIDAIMMAYRDAGLRATVTIDQPNIVEYEKYPFLGDLLPPHERRAMELAPRQGADELLELYRYLIDRWHGAAQGRLRAAVSCSAPQRVTLPYFEGLSDLSRTYDLPFDIHILETRLQRVLGQEKFGKSLVRYVHDIGLLDQRMLVMHAIWIDEHDIALLADSGCTVAHNPVCNLRLGSGLMPWRALRDAGIPICLGSDEMNTDDSVNLWFVAKTAALIHTLSSPDFDQWPQPMEILHALTSGGARGMRQAGEFGTLVPGACADMILLDLDTVAYTPLNDLRRQLVHCEDGQSLRMTIVGGQVLFEDGKITTVDEAAVRRELRELMDGYRAQLERCAADADRLEPYYRAMVDRCARIDVGMRRTLY